MRLQNAVTQILCMLLIGACIAFAENGILKDTSESILLNMHLQESVITDSSVTPDSNRVSKANPEQMDSSKISLLQNETEHTQDSTKNNALKKEPSVQNESKTSKNEHDKKTVLYLDGSENALWFQLGVLYAFESYGVHVDSIVGSSYGALLGALWKSGYSLDDIQRFFKNHYIEPYLYQNNFKQKSDYLPLSDSNAVSIRMRLAFTLDSSGLKTKRLPLKFDSLAIEKQKFRLRLEEILYRQPVSTKVSAFTCDGSLNQGAKAILNTLPVEGAFYGAGCEIPHPSEGAIENSIIVSAIPLRTNKQLQTENTFTYTYFFRELDLYKEVSTVIRPLTASLNTPDAWIQSGFSEAEKKLSAIAKTQKLFPYTTPSDSIKPKLHFIAVSDSIAANLKHHTNSFWNEEDSSFIAIDNFFLKLQKSSVYDSVNLTFLPEGNILVEANAPFQLEFNAGGFGSNVKGAFAYGSSYAIFVNQFEYKIGAAAFYGTGGYGVIPELKLLRLIDGSFSFGVRYDFMNIRPLKSYLNDEVKNVRIYEEKRGDLKLSFDFTPNDFQRISLFTLIGNREYKIHPSIESESIEVSPMAPEIELEQRSINFDKWFGTNGYSLKGIFGMESVGATFGTGESVPIFWKCNMSLNGNTSLQSFMTLGYGAAFGANVYNEDGNDYPISFGYTPVDLTIRQGIEATPFSSEWYFPEFRSHGYGLLRAHFGLHQQFFGAYAFFAFIKDFEDSKISAYSSNRLVLEPALRFSYKSLEAYMGLTRAVNASNYQDFLDFKDYRYFIKIGNFNF